MNAALQMECDAANIRAYELYKMKVIRKIEDWTVYKNSDGAGSGGYPGLAQPQIIGRMVGEKAAARRKGLGQKTETIYVCDDCGRIHSAIPRLSGCLCGKKPGHKGAGFKRIKSDSIAGKTVFASMIADTSWNKNYNSEAALDRVINNMPVEWQKVLYAQYIWSGTQEEKAEKLGVSKRQYQILHNQVLVFLVGHFYNELSPYIEGH